MRNIEKLRNYFLGKDPQLKETMTDNSLRLIGIEGKHFVLRTELIERLKALKDELTEVDEGLQRQIDAVVDDLATETQQRKDNDDAIGQRIDDLIESLDNYYTKTQTNGLLGGKQDNLTAGENIVIEDNVISAIVGGGTDTYVRKTGDTMTGKLTIKNGGLVVSGEPNKIQNLAGSGGIACGKARGNAGTIIAKAGSGANYAFGDADSYGNILAGKDSPNSMATGLAFGSASGDTENQGYIISEGLGSVAIGRTSVGTIKSSGYGSVAFGYGHNGNIISSGQGSFAGGSCSNLSYDDDNKIEASGTASFAFGWGSVTASGTGSIAMQIGAQSTSTQTCAIGHNSEASGGHSMALGWNSSAKSWCQYAFGTNVIEDYGNDGISNSDGQFLFGVGVNGTRTNGMKLTHGGDLYVAGTVHSNGADYAEVFEWEDGNPNEEDRIGFFVCIDGTKINKATANDPKQLIGIISGEPSVMGDSFLDYWHSKYETDIYGRIQTRITTETYEDEEGNTHTYSYEEPIVSASYDPSQEYIPRLKRPEYSAVGLLGKVVVRDDGTCQAKGYCYPNNDGIATAEADPNKGFYVMERLDQTHIRVLLK